MYGALITVARPDHEAFSVIMPVSAEERELARRIRTLGDLRAWLQSHVQKDGVAAAILEAVTRDLGTLDDRYPVDVRIEVPKDSE